MLKTLLELMFHIFISVFSLVANVCAIVPMFISNYTPNAIIIISCIIVFVAMSYYGRKHRTKAAAIWKDIIACSVSTT